MKTASVHILELTFDGGKGVAKLPDGKVIFIPGTCPGDFVNVEIIEDKKSFSIGKILEILEPSTSRIKPQCEIYDSCGGCNLQHVNYETQVEQKQNLLQNFLTKKNINAELLPFVKSPQTWGYRNRLEAHFENHQWGFYKPHTHSLTLTKNCLIADKEIIDKLNALEINNEHVLVAKTKDNTINVTLGRKRGQQGLFSQVNSGINQKLIYAVLEAASNSQWSQIVDFYAGSGNFSIPLAQTFKQSKVVAVELSENLVTEGRQNSNELKNLFWVQSKCEDFNFNSIISDSMVIIDPPRTGASPEFLKSIASNKHIKKVIYLSCNPPLLFRDYETLKNRFQLQLLQGFDMFPQTMHFEAFAIFSRV